MGERTRTHDWSAKSPGPVERWPQSPRTAVDIVLASPTPASVMEGQRITLRAADGEATEERVSQAAFSPIRDEAAALGGIFHALQSVAGRYSMDAYGATTVEALLRGESFVVDDVRSDPRLADPPVQRDYAVPGGGTSLFVRLPDSTTGSPALPPEGLEARP